MHYLRSEVYKAHLEGKDEIGQKPYYLRSKGSKSCSNRGRVRKRTTREIKAKGALERMKIRLESALSKR